MKNLTQVLSCMIIILFIISCEDDKEGKFSGDSGTFTDSRDGNEYNWVRIGDQIWMAENLNTTKYVNGDPIPDGSLLGDYGEEQNPQYWFAYDNDTNNTSTYGRLYTYPVVIHNSKLCPDGWHVPSQQEWTQLIDYLSPESNDAGGKLKNAGTAYWLAPNTGATNSSGFNALPGGTRSAFGHFTALEHQAFFWSSSAIAYRLYYNTDTVHVIDDWHIGYGNSVRCIKD